MNLKLRDVCAVVPGLTKEFVHYLESQHYINPQKVPTKGGRIQRNEYKEEDVSTIKEMWRLRKEHHIQPREAIDLIRNGNARHLESPPQKEGLMAFMLVKPSCPDTEAISERLYAIDACKEVSIVFGNWDLMIKVVVQDLNALQYLVVNQLRTAVSPSGKSSRSKTETLIAINHTDENFYWKDEERGKKLCEPPNLIAHVLIETNNGVTYGIGSNLPKIEEVFEDQARECSSR